MAKKVYNKEVVNNKKEVIIHNIKVVVLFKQIMDNLTIKIIIFLIHLKIWEGLISPSNEQNNYLKKLSGRKNYTKLVFLILVMTYLIMILSSEERKNKKL